MTDRELMQMALDAIEGFYPSLTELHNAHTKTAEALRARLAQPEPEPVVWKFAGALFHDRDEVFSWYKRGDVSNIPPLPLYTAPPQRKWQGLTDEEIHSTDRYEEDRKLYCFARAIEAKLKEKNT